MFEFIVDMVSRGGYLGVFLLMVLENVFPPIPSELIMPLAGFVAARGELNIVAVVAVGTAGSIIGTLPWYYAGLMVGRERLKRLADRYGRWLTVSADDIDMASDWFARHGHAATFLGRLIPAIRTLISVPAGITRMPLPSFLAYSTVGSVIWTGLLALAGYILEAQYEVVADYLDPGSKIVVGVIVAVYLYRLAFHKRRTQR